MFTIQLLVQSPQWALQSSFFVLPSDFPQVSYASASSSSNQLTVAHLLLLPCCSCSSSCLTAPPALLLLLLILPYCSCSSSCLAPAPFFNLAWATMTLGVFQPLLCYPDWHHCPTHPYLFCVITGLGQALNTANAFLLPCVCHSPKTSLKKCLVMVESCTTGVC